MASPDPIFDRGDISRAFMLLTRLPVPGGDGTRAAQSAWAWPLVGLGVGALAATLAWLALGLGLPHTAAAGLALALGMIATGGLHEDGLADCADGFWGSAERTRRLEIMKDSRIGSYGVLALILVVGLKWVLLADAMAHGTVWAALLVPAMLSRGAMAVMMAALPFARDEGEGLARHVGQPSQNTAAMAAVAAGVCALMFSGGAGLLAVLTVAVAAIGLARLALSKIGGQTGDVLGATQSLTELAALAALVALLP